MLSLSSLLNPAPPGTPLDNRFPPSPALSSPADSCGTDDFRFPDRLTMPKQKMAKDAAVFTKNKPKGAINFPPYENLDESSLRLVRKFQVYPFGKIQEYSRHIPYNSGKKDFYEKTGRESFEVFQYVFKVPGDDAEYAVMWDYNVGLVRMTPFFKCCKYPKTTPAKMLNSNPGLKEITHSITGGSIMAQGYWMPYHCAKAVCATFCHKIAGALIPIFGPEFPALCTPAEAPEYSRMIIDPTLIMESTREADYYRRLYSSSTSSSGSRNDNVNTASPKHDRRVFRGPYDENSSSRHNNPRYRIRKTYTSMPRPGSESTSPYATDTEGEISPATDRSSLARDHHSHHQPQHFLESPQIPSMLAPLRPGHSTSGWTPANIPRSHAPAPQQHHTYQASGSNPWLSAIPRFTTTAHLQASAYQQGNSPRPAPAIPSTHYLANHSAPPLPRPQVQPRSHYANNIQLHSPSEAALLSGLSYPSPRPAPKRSAGQFEDDNNTKSTQQQQRRYGNTTVLRQTNKESQRAEEHAHQHSHSHPKGEKPSIGAGADNKAALLLMNLSVRDHDFWKSVGTTSGLEVTTTTTTTTTRRNGDINSGVARPEAGAGGISRPLDGMFPRIKRVRSNSM